ncbi:MAG: TerB N-terminal domain-containing protein [Caldisericia bacterium]
MSWLRKAHRTLAATPRTQAAIAIPTGSGSGLRRLEFKIPARTAGLLYTARGPSTRGDFEFRVRLDLLSGSFEGLPFRSEPSTIFVDEPAVLPKDTSSVPGPPYYPRYGALSPYQRGIYLNWLQDPISAVDPGYLFVYYYGLERQLLLGDFQNAVDEILMLRRYHANASFQFYSLNALLTACVARNRPDKASEILSSLGQGVPSNIQLLVAARLGLSLPVDTVAGIASLLHKRVNVRYLKSNPSCYKESLAAALVSRYGTDSLPLGWVPAADMLPTKRQFTFANVSFPEKVRCPSLPSIVDSEEFIETMSSMFDVVHTSVKEYLVADRKRTKASGPP